PGVTRVQLQGLCEVGNGLLLIPLLAKGSPARAVGAGEVGIQPDRLIAAGDGLIVIPLEAKLFGLLELIARALFFVFRVFHVIKTKIDTASQDSVSCRILPTIAVHCRPLPSAAPSQDSARVGSCRLLPAIALHCRQLPPARIPFRVGSCRLLAVVAFH